MLTVDNGKSNDSDTFREYCKTVGTKLAFASVYHPESNGVVERANREIFSAISKTLYNLRKGKWVDELPKVVWSHNTSVTRATGYMPFKLLYGEEAMLPEEAKHESLRVMKSELAESEAYCKESVEQERLQVLNNIIKYQEMIKAWRDRNVVRKTIKDGDLVMRRRPNVDMVGKLQPKWEGPFRVKAIAREGSFYLEDMEGRSTTHAWNIDNLKRFYI